MSEKKYLSRNEASEFLTSMGIPCKPATLKKWTLEHLVPCLRFPKNTSPARYTKDALLKAIAGQVTPVRRQMPS